MNFKYLSALLYVCVALISIGCCSTGPLYTEKAPTPAKIAMDRYEIRIIDIRENVGGKHRSLNYISVPGQEDHWSPPVNDQMRNIVHKIIQEVKAPGDRKLTFEVNIKIGYKDFDAGVWSEVEKVYCEVITKMVNSETNQIMKSGQGICWGQVGTAFATEENFESMWLQAFERAVIQSVNNLQEL